MRQIQGAPRRLPSNARVGLAISGGGRFSLDRWVAERLPGKRDTSLSATKPALFAH